MIYTVYYYLTGVVVDGRAERQGGHLVRVERQEGSSTQYTLQHQERNDYHITAKKNNNKRNKSNNSSNNKNNSRVTRATAQATTTKITATTRTRATTARVVANC